jgi:hypothetical protein
MSCLDLDDVAIVVKLSKHFFGSSPVSSITSDSSSARFPRRTFETAFRKWCAMCNATVGGDNDGDNPRLPSWTQKLVANTTSSCRFHQKDHRSTRLPSGWDLRGRQRGIRIQPFHACSGRGRRRVDTRRIPFLTGMSICPALPTSYPSLRPPGDHTAHRFSCVGKFTDRRLSASQRLPTWTHSKHFGSYTFETAAASFPSLDACTQLESLQIGLSRMPIPSVTSGS